MTTDGGNTWSDRNVLFSGGATGMVHNLMMAYADGIFYSFWNIQYRQLWCSRSKDGLTWEEPRDLTRMLWRAESEYPWNAFGIGSGHCVRLSNGRILIPTWFTTGGDNPAGIHVVEQRDNGPFDDELSADVEPAARTVGASRRAAFEHRPERSYNGLVVGIA